MKPLVSVIVATYRRDEELANALVSLAKQDCSSLEIVLVDDNALQEWNEKVEKIVSDFRNRFPKVPLHYIVNCPNQGSAQTRNIGIEAAEGDYITFLDDDDVYLTSKVSRQLLFMELEHLDYSLTDLEIFNNSGKLVDKRARTYIIDTSQRALFEYHLKYHMTGTDTMMFRKDYLVSIGGFPLINVGDEFYLMQRAIERGGRFGYLPGCDVKAYVHAGEGGLSSGQGKVDGENILYEHKQKYFAELNPKTVKYIKARHYAVLAYAYLRMHAWGGFLKNSFRGFFSSPFLFCKILLKR